ncbi:MAG: hypothetical protein L0Y62_03840, partial [Nitrospirae bacterium]|nr:hypothetical protein [Nitrospirota bacterium]
MNKGIITDKREAALIKTPNGYRQWTSDALFTITKLNNIIGFLPINLDGILKSVVDETYNLFSPHTCCVYMISDDNTLRLVASKNLDGAATDVHYDSNIQ